MQSHALKQIVSYSICIRAAELYQTLVCNYRITNIAAIHYSHISAVLTENFQVYMWGQCKGMYEIVLDLS